jgi:hypothetical protein
LPRAAAQDSDRKPGRGRKRIAVHEVRLGGRADRLSGTAGLAQLAELATDLHGMAHDIKSA